MRRTAPALVSLLAVTGMVLTGCAGIIPAVAGETVAAEPKRPGALQPKPVDDPAPALDPAAPTDDPPASALPDADGGAFARFVRYADAARQGATSASDMPSALLADPIALDGKRRRCALGEQLVVVIDLDPAGGLFAPPASPVASSGAAPGLALLRDAGFKITWISDLPTERSGSVRSALEQSGLDPRGQDILSLRRDEGDTKDQRKASLGGFACIVAIAGDERTDFDLRFKYLRKPEAGAALEGLIGDGWFLVAPLIGN